ncbi:FAD-dependent oxidoreductase [Flammeovirgaceae bacterium SG7u.111]|nr:FAD-dependent oxidoreductase [Flammeovirgaceae bacterium SG7u.132]WPO35139.1 FAD-dependent oxidoreductase [Flammeovirgaceae bacterium SG7u.111]
MASKKTVIIGGGVIGICSAYYLNKKGFEVTVLDQNDFQDSASFGNAGMVVPSHFIPMAAPGMIALGMKWMFNPESPFHIKPRLNKELFSWGWKFYKAATPHRVKQAIPVLKDLNLTSKKLFEEIATDESLDFAFQKKGLMMYCKTEAALHEEKELATEANKIGIKAEVLGKEEAQSIDSGLELDIHGAIYFPMDAFLTPHLFLNGLKEKLEQKGVTFLANTQVTGFETNGQKITTAQTSAGAIEADEFVIASGSWSSSMLKGLNISMPLMAGKGYSFVIPEPKAKPEICSILTEARVAVTPMAHGLRIAGTMELAGIDLSINKRRLEGIYKSIPKYFPQFSADDFRDIEVWSGLRPCSPDGIPYIGRFQKYPNLIAATGHSMMGLSLGPVTGKIVAQLVANEKQDVESKLLAVDRYN